MDFGTLLHVAKKNSENVKSSQGKYYSTKFSAPKKETKEKTLSDNIKKFLEKKEQEERLKARLEKEKKEKLLAMRDEKSKNKIKKMLKVIKSANKSVLEDAVDSVNTAVTLQGPDQPDEDDYGYVSQEAAALYRKYMDKVKAMPDEKKFAPSRPQSKHDLSGTKDRVKAAIQREQQEKNNPIRSKSSSKASLDSSTSLGVPSTQVPTPSISHRRKELYDPQAEKELEEKRRREEEQKKVKLKKPAPPPLDFKDLLKLAEKKQYEPVEIVIEPKKEPERLLTKKEKKEIEERQKYQEERERRKKEGVQNSGKALQNGKIPKMEQKNSTFSTTKKNSNEKNSNPIKHSANETKDTLKKSLTSDQISSSKIPNSKTKLSSLDNTSQKSNISANNNKAKPLEGNSGNNSLKTPKTSLTSNSNGLKSATVKSSVKPSSVAKSASALPLKPSYDGVSRQFPPKDTQINRKNPIADSKDARARKLSLPDSQKTRSFPPPDVRSSKPLKRPVKRRILDDDEDEYDSELDDFIDDGPEDEQNYSNYIKEIFGYDKSRYRDAEDDDAAMESTFAQQMKEEYLSKKIGLMEDLEDMRLEAEEKKKKMLVKKRKLK